MSADDNDKWLDAVAGRGQVQDPDADREIAMIRDFYRKTSDGQASSDDARHSERQARMHQWLRERGAYTEVAPQPAAVPERFANRKAANRTWYAVVATVLLAVFALPLVQNLTSKPSDGDMPAMRGSHDIQQVAVQDPAAIADRLEQLLSSYGVPVRRVDEQGAIRLETRVPEAKIDEARTALSPYKINVPPDGILILRISRRP